mmetsp:Transcript_3558/g.8877  ORF Transcript_3558/g.8877 Transcript_3558/m.8877 type:complete len:320 (-) Transcript_3558:1589-2548(-)
MVHRAPIIRHHHLEFRSLSTGEHPQRHTPTLTHTSLLLVQRHGKNRPAPHVGREGVHAISSTEQGDVSQPLAAGKGRVWVVVAVPVRVGLREVREVDVGVCLAVPGGEGHHDVGADHLLAASHEAHRHVSWEVIPEWRDDGQAVLKGPVSKGVEVRYQLIPLADVEPVAVDPSNLCRRNPVRAAPSAVATGTLVLPYVARVHTQGDVKPHTRRQPLGKHLILRRPGVFNGCRVVREKPSLEAACVSAVIVDTHCHHVCLCLHVHGERVEPAGDVAAPHGRTEPVDAEGACTGEHEGPLDGSGPVVTVVAHIAFIDTLQP